MSKDAFCYTFRFCCDPGFNDRSESEALLRFIDEALIDDVAVFVNVEELNTGHMDEGEQEVYLSLMRELKPRMEQKGVTLSVNHWHSIMHADLGKHLRENQHFRRMVDVDGREAELCVCPMDEAWRKYIAEVYARYAELQPEIVWVEDDFRYHNHDPLHWGGCFCEEHMKLYSALAGKPLTREEFIAGVLQSGEPHPYRRIWLDVCSDVLCETASRIEKAVHGIAPQTRVGLMSSAPQIHAAEGREWHRLLKALAGANKPVDRIHLPGYTEGAAWNYLQNFNMVAMACRAFLPLETKVYPELENYPYSRFAKSRSFTRFQLLAGMPLDMAGITIDLYDLNGNGIVWEEGYQRTLCETKPYMNRLTELGIFHKEKRGVCVMVNERAAYSLHTAAGKDMEELYPHEVFFAGLLPAMGIPFRYCTEAEVCGETVAVSGQYLRGLTQEQVRHLFDYNFVILTGDAAVVLTELELGALAGIECCTWHCQNEGDYAYEQVVNGRTYCGIPVARASAVISCSDVLEVEYSANVKTSSYTAFYDSYRRYAFAGQTVVNGRVLIYPFGRFAQPLDIPQMLLNSVRQAIFQEILGPVLPKLPLVEKSPYLEPYCTVSEEKLCLYLVNGSSDAAEAVQLNMGGLKPDHITVIPSLGEESTMDCIIENGRCTLPINIPSMEAVLLIFSE